MKLVATGLWVMLIVLLLMDSSKPIGANTKQQNGNLCHSVYRVHQLLDLSVNLGDIQNQQRVDIATNIHIKQVASIVSKDKEAAFISNSKKNKTSYVVKIESVSSKVNGVFQDQGLRYQHPFIVTINDEDGSIVDIDSTTEDEAVLNEYLSFMDLFQITKHQGEFQYKNSNGYYLALVTPSNSKSLLVKKRNLGYLQSDKKIKIDKSEFSATLSDSECFFERAHGFETYRVNLSPKVYMQGEGKTKIESLEPQQLTPLTSFNNLSYRIEEWPTYHVNQPVTQEIAYSRIENMLKDLATVNGKTQQQKAIVNKYKKAWPHLLAYHTEKSLEEEQVKLLFRSLRKINSLASISVLIDFIVNHVNQTTMHAAVVSLASTSAKLHSRDLARLTEFTKSIANKKELDKNQQLFIEVLGMLVKRKSLSSNSQSESLKTMILERTVSSTRNAKKFFVKSIEHYVTDYDLQSKNILLSLISSQYQEIRFFAAMAAKKLLLDSSMIETICKQLEKESILENRKLLISLLSRSKSTNKAIKTLLFSLLKKSSFSSSKGTILTTLSHINYLLTTEEVSFLKHLLSREVLPVNKKILAAMILKHR